ncbi:MAG: acyl-CoA dehydrogenase family protein [Pseudomonadales bacterium]
MSFALQPQTPAGAAVVAAAAQLVPELAARAAQADQDNSLCEPNFAALVDSGVAAAFVPESLGGFGLQSVHDWILTIATLARGDASTAIAINMQLGVSRGMAQAWSAALAREQSTAALEAPLKALASGAMKICATATEPGTDNLHPLTEAVRDGDDYLINGHKIFVTMSPIATHLGMNLRMRDDSGDHLVTTMLPMNAAGVAPQDDWDALGMRGSGSQSVKLRDVRVPASAIRRLGPWGAWSPGVLMNRAMGNLPLVGAFLGIAEAARDLAVAKLSARERVGKALAAHSGMQHLTGEMEIELAQCRTILSAAGRAFDQFLSDHPAGPPGVEEGHRLMKDYQAAKWVVNRGAIDIVSKAMDLMGGAGYTNAHPLARLYRDVRAGPFMQPFAPYEAREYIGAVTLEQWPLG